MIHIGQPILLQSVAFDATQDHTFEFTYSGNQVVKHTFVVKDNETNATVYNVTTSSYQLHHTVPADSLDNGTCYNATVMVYDANDNASIYSVPIVFWCYSTPSFTVDIENNQVIENTSVTIEISYSQTEGELLNSWQAELYDYSQRVISQSGIKYSGSPTTYTFTGLADNDRYYIRCVGETLNGMTVDTGLIAITVHYTAPSFFTLNEVTNDAMKGIIKLKTNIYIVTGKSNPDPPIYIDEDLVDLRESGHWVKFDEGFTLSGDFCQQIICNQLNPNSVILYGSGDNQEIALVYRHWLFSEQTSEQAVIQLLVYGDPLTYTTYTTPMSIPASDDWLYITFTRANGLYDISCEKIEVS